jgi:transposase
VSKWDKNERTKQYSKEFKEEAVALIRDQGYTVPEAAKSLGIASNIRYRWKDKIASDLEGKSLSADEREELIRLRKENKNLRMKKEILKKRVSECRITSSRKK